MPASDADHYRMRAAECEERARADPNNAFRVHWETMAPQYRALAEQADRITAMLATASQTAAIQPRHPPPQQPQKDAENLAGLDLPAGWPFDLRP